MGGWRARGWARVVVVAAAGARVVPLVVGVMILQVQGRALAEPFPFGTELILDAQQMRGSKKVPSIDINHDGTADIDLWCNKVKARFVVAANTVTIITGEMSPRQCPPERARADDELMAALNAVTSWRMDGEALVLTGGRTLRFLAPTN